MTLSMGPPTRSGGAGATMDGGGKVVETASVVDGVGATVVGGRLVAGDVRAGRVVAGADGPLVVLGAMGPPGRETVGRGRPALALRGRAALTDPTKAIDTATAQVNTARVRSWGCVFMPPGCAAPLWRFHEGPYEALASAVMVRFFPSSGVHVTE